MKLLFIQSISILLSLVIGKKLIYKLPCTLIEDLQKCVGKLVTTPSGLESHKSHSGVIVTDPLDSNQYALTFAEVADSGDMFCGNLKGYNFVEVCIDYFGKTQVNAESGGFLGLAKNYQNDINWFFGASQYGYKWGSRLYKQMQDTNNWQTLCYSKSITKDEFSIAIEDWNYAGTTTKDAYFRNIQVYDLEQENLDDTSIIQEILEEYAVDTADQKPYNQYQLTWQYNLDADRLFFNITFPLPDMSQLNLLASYELGIFVGLFPYQDNSTSVSLIEHFNPIKTIYEKSGIYYCTFYQYITQTEFEDNYPCELTKTNQNTCFGKIYFYPQSKALSDLTSYVEYRLATTSQLLRYDFELQTTKSYTTLTETESLSYDLSVKTLVSDIPCEKCNCDNECTASVIIDASTYYTFTYCNSEDDCSTNHSSGYTYADKLVILITSKIGPHDFSIHSMYVYYPTADSDTVGDGYELPIDDIILQKKTTESMKYTYTISQQAGYFEGGGKAAKLKILLQNSTTSSALRRLLESELAEVKKFDYSITVTEDTSVHLASTNNWNNFFKVLSYVFLGINAALFCLLVAFFKRYFYDIKQSIKFYNGEQQQGQDDQQQTALLPNRQGQEEYLRQQEQIQQLVGQAPPPQQQNPLQQLPQQLLDMKQFESGELNQNVQPLRENTTNFEQESYH